MRITVSYAVHTGDVQILERSWKLLSQMLAIDNTEPRSPAQTFDNDIKDPVAVFYTLINAVGEKRAEDMQICITLV